MEVVRKFVNADELLSIIQLPETLKNRKLEIIILPAEEAVEVERKDNEVEEIVDSLTGILPDLGMTLDDCRTERLKNMKLLIDANVVLDVLIKREPFFEKSAEALKLSSRKDVEEFVSASAITDIYYIVYKALKDREAAKGLISKLLKVVSVAAVSSDEINEAIKQDWADFEDAVQYSVALIGGLQGIQMTI